MKRDSVVGSAGVTRLWVTLASTAVLLLSACSDPGATSVERPARPTTATATRSLDPARIYRLRCATCHQPNGKGVGSAFPPLAGSSWAQGEERRPIRIVLHGLHGKIRVDGKEYNGVMPGLAKQMSDEEIAAVLTYVRSSWGNNAPAITAESVRTVRKAEGARSSLWTEAELLRD